MEANQKSSVRIIFSEKVSQILQNNLPERRELSDVNYQRFIAELINGSYESYKSFVFRHLVNQHAILIVLMIILLMNMFVYACPSAAICRIG